MSLYANWPRYPKLADVDAWKKAHGVLGKKIETDHAIAAHLKKLEELDAKIGRGYFSANVVPVDKREGVSVKTCDDAKKDIDTQMKNYEAFSGQVTKLTTAVKKGEADVKAGKLIPKGVGAFLTRMLAEVNTYDQEVVKHIKQVLKELKEIRDQCVSDEK